VALRHADACCLRRATPLTDAIALEGLRRAARSLRAVWLDGSNLDAREDLCVASLCGGLSLANAKLGAVHGFAGPLGGMLHGPHGALCAAMLPAACAVNVEALSAGGAAAAPALARFVTVARILTGREDASAADGVAWLTALCAEFGIPGLASYGMSEARFAEAVEKGKKSSSMKGNPVPLSDDQMADILRRSM
jgi:alcohol dehydrogenase class IV